MLLPLFLLRTKSYLSQGLSFIRAAILQCLGTNLHLLRFTMTMNMTDLHAGFTSNPEALGIMAQFVKINPKLPAVTRILPNHFDKVPDQHACTLAKLCWLATRLPAPRRPTDLDEGPYILRQAPRDCRVIIAQDSEGGGW